MAKSLAETLGPIATPKLTLQSIAEHYAQYLEVTHDREFTDIFANTFLSWQDVEARLFLIFHALVPTKDNGTLASVAFHAVMNLDARLAMISAVAQVQLEKKHKTLYEKWGDLVEDTRKEARKRNRLAHFSLQRHTSKNRGKSGLRLRPSIYDARPSNADYGMNELRRFKTAFQKLAGELEAFKDEVRKVVPR